MFRKRGRKPEDHDMTLQEWVNEYMGYVDKMVGEGHNPLNLGQYTTLSRSNGVCLKSLVGMESLLLMILGGVPCAVLNFTKLQKVLELVGWDCEVFQKPWWVGRVYGQATEDCIGSLEAGCSQA